MSIENALYSWKQLAENTVELSNLKHRIDALEELVRAAQGEFDETLDELPSSDRDAIFSIMSVYEESTGDSKEDLHWLLNKVGNEGVEGISWASLREAWTERFPNRSHTELGMALRRHQSHFLRVSEGKQELYRLTPVGQAAFLNG